MYVITQTCCSDAACVSVCPVNCIHPTPEERGFGSSDILHIDPEACIDCGACADACPVDAIYPADKLGTRDKVFIDINAAFYRNNTDISSGWTPVTYPVIPKLPAGLRVALVGTGPSAGYALRALLDLTTADVTVIDKLPTPGGLVRAGVAPDHPGTKKVLEGFDLLYRDPRVTLATNVEVGEDIAAGQITPAELSEHFDAVFYAVGASDSRRLGIPGEDLPGSTSATDLVAWYNSAPDVTDTPLPQTNRSGRVVVVGTGNVALDVARILVSPPDVLATTDIADRALKILRSQNVSEVVVLGRQDQARAAYSSAEYRALSSIPDVELIVQDDPATVVDLSTPADPGKRRIVFRFQTTPEEIIGTDRVDGLRVRTGDHEHVISADLIVRSIGYRSTPIAGLPFDEGRGVFPNIDGRIADTSGTIVAGAYVAGWAKRGPSGGIGANKICAEDTVGEFIKDAANGALSRTQRSSSEFKTLLRGRKRAVIGYRGVRAIDRAERRLGAESDRPRVKFTTVGDMVRAAGRHVR